MTGNNMVLRLFFVRFADFAVKVRPALAEILCSTGSDECSNMHSYHRQTNCGRILFSFQHIPAVCTLAHTHGSSLNYTTNSSVHCPKTLRTQCLNRDYLNSSWPEPFASQLTVLWHNFVAKTLSFKNGQSGIS